jgi:hypothetical protein
MNRAAIRRTGLALAVSAIAVAATAAGEAQAATIHACVKPRSGATRIVGVKARCRHGEQKLSWNTNGPQGKSGPAGAPGAAGTPGATGTGPAFVTGAAETIITEAPSVMFAATIPPGSYVLSGSVTVTAGATTAGTLVDAGCFAVDIPGTSLTTGDLAGKAIQTEGFGIWESPLAQESVTKFRAVSTMMVAGTIESKVTSTMGVTCDDVDTSAGVTVKAVVAELFATQVSSISLST